MLIRGRRFTAPTLRIHAGYKANKKRPLPIHVYHSTNDQVFPYDGAKETVKKLTKAGYIVTMTTDNQQHNIGTKLQQAYRDLRTTI